MSPTITIPQREYDRLRRYQRQVEKWRQYLRHVRDIEQARREIAEGKVISAEELYKQLGIE